MNANTHRDHTAVDQMPPSSQLCLELDLLPAVLDLLESLRTDKDQQELTRKVMGFKAKVQQCRELIKKTPGLELSAEEQEEHLKNARDRLKDKRFLLEKFKHLQILTSSW